MKRFIKEISNTDPADIFARLQHLPYSLLLDSADRDHENGRYSFIACHPVEMIEAKNGIVTVTNRDQQTSFESDPFKIVQQRLAAWAIDTEAEEGLPPFQGGAAGLFGYDLGRNIEDLPASAKDNPEMPDMAVGIYDQVIAFDHEQGKAWIITQSANEEDARRKQHFVLSLMQKDKPQTGGQYAEDIVWQPAFSRAEYKTRIEQVIAYIRAGDVFQANLSQRFDAELPRGFDEFTHYKRMRTVNPAPFAAFMNLGAVKISSASPERFLTVTGGQVETKPIKGTAARSSDPAEDEKNKEALIKSEKDRAENTMIVDLLRNDLSKVCEADSIRVDKLCALESFASVHHLVSTVTGTLKNGKDALDLLRACFPGGSITGAPKIRAMEIIEELEPARRGPYCGSIGYIGFDGSMDSNILIRTLVYHNDTVSLQAGGGITADSDPDAEYEETLDKAKAIFASFEAETALKKTG